MSVVEKAGANVLKATFDKKSKKKNKDKEQKRPDEVEIQTARTEPEALKLDYARLGRMGFYTPEDRSSQLALELRAVKRRLLRRIGYLRSSGERQAYRTPGKQRNLILVTSTRAGEGKTFTAINLALSLALEDQIETLLIDADLARPKVREQLDLAAAPGFDHLGKRDPQLVVFLLERRAHAKQVMNLSCERRARAGYDLIITVWVANT